MLLRSVLKLAHFSEVPLSLKFLIPRQGWEW